MAPASLRAGVGLLQFDWDPAKAVANEVKHGVTFTEEATAFGDPLSLTVTRTQSTPLERHDSF